MTQLQLLLLLLLMSCLLPDMCSEETRFSCRQAKGSDVLLRNLGQDIRASPVGILRKPSTQRRRGPFVRNILQSSTPIMHRMVPHLNVTLSKNVHSAHGLFQASELPEAGFKQAWVNAQREDKYPTARRGARS